MLALAVGWFGLVSVRAEVVNGSFTNNASGWTGTSGSGTNGAPRVVTNGMTIVVQIGTNATAGVPGVTGGKLVQKNFPCDPTGGGQFCTIQFTAKLTQAPGEKAKVTLEGVSGINSREIPPGGPTAQAITLDKTCQTAVTLTFTILPAKPGAKINSSLEISGVSSHCSSLPNNTMNVLLASYNDPRRVMAPMPYNNGAFGSFAVVVPGGASPLATAFQGGGNLLDTILPAADNSQLKKYNPQTSGFDTYTRIAGHWSPAGGTLQPGDAAFILSVAPGSFSFGGNYVPLPLRSHPTNGSAYYGNPLPWPAYFEDVTGFKPVVGDVLTTFQHGAGAFPPPAQSTFTFTPDTFPFQPTINPGETIMVQFAAPSSVPLSTSLDPNGVMFTAAGGLPSDGVLQQADTLGSFWKSLSGVADFYLDPLDSDSRFFRLGFGLPVRNIAGHLVAADGVTPVTNTVVQLGPNGNVTTTDSGGNFTFANVPVGKVNIDSFFDIFTQIGLQTNNSESQRIDIDILIPPGVSPQPVQLKMDPPGPVTVPPPPPPCTCTPWCGIIGGFVGGYLEVGAGGGVYPKGCDDNGTASVTITGPGGITVNLGKGGRKSFFDAPAGVWTVTSTACGMTKTCSITLP